jgi:phosphatidylethanolamine/phosphatidyl-N-methylethanolamine N-methyltransferase
MRNQPQLPARSNHHLAFLRAFFRRPRAVGSLVPSSPFLERRMVQLAGAASAPLLVELGPGTGGTTRALLRAMREDARLLAIELDPDFLPILRRIPDPRLSVHAGNARDMSAILAEHGLEAPEVVISGIPFSTMGDDNGRAVLQAIHEVLPTGGRFVAYQLRDRVQTLADPVFGPGRVELELWNIPPMRVYCWERQARRGNGRARAAA